MSEDSGQVDVARVPDLENPNFELNDHSIALFHVRGPFFFFFFLQVLITVDCSITLCKSPGTCPLTVPTIYPIACANHLSLFWI